MVTNRDGYFGPVCDDDWDMYVVSNAMLKGTKVTHKNFLAFSFKNEF